MIFEVGYILKENEQGAMVLDYSHHVPEKITFSRTLKASLFSIFREWPAWKSSAQDVMRWDIAHRYFSNIAICLEIEIFLVGLSQILINFTSKHALMALPRQSQMKSAKTTEEINKAHSAALSCATFALQLL